MKPYYFFWLLVLPVFIQAGTGQSTELCVTTHQKPFDVCYIKKVPAPVLAEIMLLVRIDDFKRLTDKKKKRFFFINNDIYKKIKNSSCFSFFIGDYSTKNIFSCIPKAPNQTHWLPNVDDFCIKNDKLTVKINYENIPGGHKQTNLIFGKPSVPFEYPCPAVCLINTNPQRDFCPPILTSCDKVLAFVSNKKTIFVVAQNGECKTLFHLEGKKDNENEFEIAWQKPLPELAKKSVQAIDYFQEFKAVALMLEGDNEKKDNGQVKLISLGGTFDPQKAVNDSVRNKGICKGLC